jgi:hypothetical protein
MTAWTDNENDACAPQHVGAGRSSICAGTVAQLDTTGCPAACHSSDGTTQVI